jgi:hypothetical protein
MKRVIMIGEEPQKESKGVEFTHRFNDENGWGETFINSNDEDIEKIVYLGKCKKDGDMFAVYFRFKTIIIFKGHLNDGTY